MQLALKGYEIRQLDYDVDTKLFYLLKELAIDPSLLGYELITTTVKMIIEDINMKFSVYENMYIILAEKYNRSNYKSLENSMRHAIKKSWEKGSATLQNKLFGYCVGKTGAPSVLTFISTLAKVIQLDLIEIKE